MPAAVHALRLFRRALPSLTPLRPLASTHVRFKSTNIHRAPSQMSDSAPPSAAPAVAAAAPLPAQTGPKQDSKKNKSRFQGRNCGPPQKKRRVEKPAKDFKEGTSEEVLAIDIENLLAQHRTEESEAPPPSLPEPFSEIELTIHDLSSTGDGLSVLNNRVYVVPFSLPGDKVLAKVVRHLSTHSMTDFLSVVTPSPDRNDSLVGCKYFSTCGGCQFQMLSYERQLAHKKRVVQKAYENFSDLPMDILPPIGETIGSPLEYGYRTKLTPHFDGPRRGKGGFKPGDPVPEIGFMVKGRRHVLDIEDCPIGTPAVREGITSERKRVSETIHTFRRGATLLLRESTKRIPDAEDLSKYTEEKLCITNSKATSTEYVGDFKFESPAGAFFQNNNSILVKFTAYVRSNLSLPVTTTISSSSSEAAETSAPKYLVDAYCGSGLFTVACGQSLERVVGVDISSDSISYARRNAEANNIHNAEFIDGNAEKIFEKIKFPGAETSTIIDPPRKGCDKLFLDQLLDFGPKRIVYISCNVHTQARDLGYLLKHEKGKGYRVDSIRGFDFFPQTHHVESVAVLTKLD
ncbi:tRNA(m5U54)methyltransferase [Rhizina undulata]